MKKVSLAYFLAHSNSTKDPDYVWSILDYLERDRKSGKKETSFNAYWWINYTDSDLYGPYEPPKWEHVIIQL